MNILASLMAKPLILLDTGIVLGLTGQQSLYQCFRQKMTPTTNYIIIGGYIVFYEIISLNEPVSKGR